MKVLLVLVKWLIRSLLILAFLCCVTVVFLTYATSQAVKEIKKQDLPFGINATQVTVRQNITSNHIDLGPQSITVPLGKNTLSIDIEWISIKINWLDSLRNFKPTLSRIDAEIFLD